MEVTVDGTQVLGRGGGWMREGRDIGGTPEILTLRGSSCRLLAHRRYANAPTRWRRATP